MGKGARLRRLKAKRRLKAAREESKQEFRCCALPKSFDARRDFFKQLALKGDTIKGTEIVFTGFAC